MERRTVLGVGATIAIIVGLIFIGFVVGGINLTDYITQTAVGLTLLAFGVVYWAFKPKIDSWAGLSQTNEYSRPPSKPQQTKYNLALFMGSPDFVDPKYIWHYHSRDRINFQVFMKLAKKKIRMSALTFSVLTLQHEELLCQLASDEIRLTFLILDPHSEEAKRQTSLYKSSEDLIDQINRSLQRLCKLKQQYPENVFIKTYTKLHGDSITIVDDSVIKVEKHVVDSGPNSRENEIIFKKDSKKEFLNYRKELDDLDKSSTEYTCQSNLSLK